MDFSYDVKKIDPTHIELSLNGYFDEFAKLPPYEDLSGLKKLSLNFENVNFINSGGIKLWVTFASNLEIQESLQVYFHNCRRIIVDQINLIEGFLPKNGEVVSVFVPVFCNRCEQGFEVFFETAKFETDFYDILSRIDLGAESEHPDCKHRLEIDIIKDQFFKFLKISRGIK